MGVLLPAKTDQASRKRAHVAQRAFHLPCSTAKSERFDFVQDQKEGSGHPKGARPRPTCAFSIDETRELTFQKAIRKGGRARERVVTRQALH